MTNEQHSTRPWAEARPRLRDFDARVKNTRSRLQALGPGDAVAAALVLPDLIKTIAAIQDFARRVLRNLGYPDQLGFVREADGSFRPIRPGGTTSRL